MKRPEASGTVNICRCMSHPELPLESSYDGNKFEIYFDGTGLFVAVLSDKTSDDLRTNRNLGVYRGAMCESIAFEALRKSGYNLYCYEREDSTLGQDFFACTREWLVLVEMKSKKGTTRSIRTLIASDSYSETQLGVKLSTGNIGNSEHASTASYFTAFLLRQLLRAYDEGQAPMLSNPGR